MITRTAGLLLALFALAACGDDAAPTTAGNAEKNGPAAANQEPKAPLKDRAKEAVDAGIRFLKPYHDLKSGQVGFSPADPTGSRHPGFAAMAAIAYMESPRRYNSRDDGPIVRNVLDWLVSLQKPDGSIYERDSANYVTSVALTALVLSGDDRYADAISKARDFLVRLQAREDTGYQPGDRFYGGIGYGGDLRPDLSNAQFAIEAVRRAGLPEDHAFYQRALKFLERCQNWSETNDQVWKDEDGNEIRPGNDGGAIYLPGESKAGVEVQPDGRRVLRSYGSMSYALLKSYLFCGLDRNDPRVKAVVAWCQRNFDLDRHPGFPTGKGGNESYQGLYYYYLSMAKCLRVYGDLEFETGGGTRVNWAEAMIEKLLALQREDGGWVNDRNGRWQEGSEALCTLYALQAIEECLAALKS